MGRGGVERERGVKSEEEQGAIEKRREENTLNTKCSSLGTAGGGWKMLLLFVARQGDSGMVTSLCVMGGTPLTCRLSKCGVRRVTGKAETGE